MKFLTSAALWALLASTGGAFTLSNYQCRPSTQLSAAPAVSREEDLMLTLKVIMDHAERSSTVSKEQYIQL